MTKYSQLYIVEDGTGAIPGRTHGSSGVHKDLRGELGHSANANYHEPTQPLQTPPPVSVAQRCAAIEARLREKQFHTESSTATVSPSSVTDPRQHAQHTLDSQQQLQHASTASRGETPATQQRLIHIHQATCTASAASYQFDEATRETRPLAKEATVTLDDNAAVIHHRQPTEPPLGCGLLELGPDGASSHIHQATGTVGATSHRFDETTRKTRAPAAETTINLGDNTASDRQRQTTEPMLECDLVELGPDGAWHFTSEAFAFNTAQPVALPAPRTRSQLPRPRPRHQHATPVTGAIGETDQPLLQFSTLGPTCARGRGLFALLDAEEQNPPAPPPPRRCGTARGDTTPDITTAIDSHPPPSEEAQEDRRRLDRTPCPEGVSASSESPFPQLRLQHIIRRRRAASAINAAARGWAARQGLHGASGTGRLSQPQLQRGPAAPASAGKEVRLAAAEGLVPLELSTAWHGATDGAHLPLDDIYDDNPESTVSDPDEDAVLPSGPWLDSWDAYDQKTYRRARAKARRAHNATARIRSRPADNAAPSPPKHAHAVSVDEQHQAPLSPVLARVTAGTTLSTALAAACRGQLARATFRAYRRAASAIAAAWRSTIQRRMQQQQAEAARRQRKQRESAAAEALRVQQQAARCKAERDRRARAHEADVRKLARERAQAMADELELTRRREAYERMQAVVQRLRAQQPPAAKALGPAWTSPSSTPGKTKGDRAFELAKKTYLGRRKVLTVVVTVDGADGYELLVLAEAFPCEMHGFVASPEGSRPGDTFSFWSDTMELLPQRERSMRPACLVKHATWLPADSTHWSRAGAAWTASEGERVRRMVGRASRSVLTATRRPLASPPSAGVDGQSDDGDSGIHWAGPRARVGHDPEAYEAEADDGAPRGDGYDEGYDHGRCDAAGDRGDQSEYDDGDADGPERYEQWYYEEFYGDAEDMGGEPWSGAAE